MSRGKMILLLLWGLIATAGTGATVLLVLVAQFGLWNRPEELVADEVQRAGGTVRRDGSGPRAPIVGITVPNGKATDYGVRRLPLIKTLREVNVSGADVTDDSMKALAQLPELEELSLLDCSITDAGLKELEALPKLKSLVLCGTKVTDEGVAAFCVAMPDCRVSTSASRNSP
jgi:hypothetical protein